MLYWAMFLFVTEQVAVPKLEWVLLLASGCPVHFHKKADKSCQHSVSVWKGAETVFLLPSWCSWTGPLVNPTHALIQAPDPSPATTLYLGVYSARATWLIVLKYYTIPQIIHTRHRLSGTEYKTKISLSLFCRHNSQSLGWLSLKGGVSYRGWRRRLRGAPLPGL